MSYWRISHTIYLTVLKGKNGHVGQKIGIWFSSNSLKIKHTRKKITVAKICTCSKLGSTTSSSPRTKVTMPQTWMECPTGEYALKSSICLLRRTDTVWGPWVSSVCSSRASVSFLRTVCAQTLVRLEFNKDGGIKTFECSLENPQRSWKLYFTRSDKNSCTEWQTGTCWRYRPRNAVTCESLGLISPLMWMKNGISRK